MFRCYHGNGDDVLVICVCLICNCEMRCGFREREVLKVNIRGNYLLSPGPFPVPGVVLFLIDISIVVFHTTYVGVSLSI